MARPADDSNVTIALAIAVARLVAAPQPMEPVSFSVTHVEDAAPQIVHLYNLDAGPTRIVLSRGPSEDGKIRIFNAVGEGVQEIAQPPLK